MDYMQIQKELLKTARSKISQSKISDTLKMDSNKFYRWETGKTQMPWTDFVQFCRVCSLDLPAAIKRCYNIEPDSQSFDTLVRVLIGTRSITIAAKEFGFSRSMLSRWAGGNHVPNLTQMIRLMYLGSVDFFRFLDELLPKKTLPCLKEEIFREYQHLELYYKFPWLSILLSALDLESYQKEPTTKFLAKKSKLTTKQVKETIEALYEQGLLHWNGRYWETRIRRIAMRGHVEGRKKTLRYVFSRAMEGIETGFDPPVMKYSWKIFSLNEKQYELIKVRYQEFFSDLGTLIDSGQNHADKVYLYMGLFIDFDHLPEPKV